MDKAEQLKFRHDLGIFTQTLAFYLFGTAGMFAIATALLAGPVVRHYHDQRALEIQQYKIDKLTDRHNQQNQLLNQLDNEAIVKRAARMTLNVVSSPDDILAEQLDNFQINFPELTEAILRACDDFPKEKPKPNWFNYCQMFSERPVEKNALLIIGGGLLAVSLTCFASSKAPPRNTNTCK